MMTVLEQKFMQRVPDLLYEISESLTVLIAELKSVNEKLSKDEK